MSTWRVACPTWAFALVVVVLAVLGAVVVAACRPPAPEGIVVQVVDERKLATLVTVSDDVVVVFADGGSFNAEELELGLKAVAFGHRVYGTTAVNSANGWTWALIVHVGPLEELR